MATTALRAGERVPLRAYVDRYLGPGQPWWRQTWNALVQPLLAPSFAGFWCSWNPVQGYYLRWWCYRPARRVLPRPAAVLVTFTASGLVHNLIAVALSRRINPFVTVWFVLYGAVTVVSGASGRPGCPAGPGRGPVSLAAILLLYDLGVRRARVTRFLSGLRPAGHVPGGGAE